MQITINDNNINSTLEYEENSFPTPIVTRFKYEEGCLSLIDSNYHFFNLNSTLDYSLTNEYTLDFNFDEYNTPDSITINNGTDSYTLEEGDSVLIVVDNLTISINRSLGLPIIFKSRTGEILEENHFTGTIQVSVDDNTLKTSNDIIVNYEDEIEDKTRESLSGFIDEVTGTTYIQSNTFNSNKGIVLSPTFEIDYLEIVFYKLSTDKNVLNKNPYLTEYFRAKGVLKEGTSIINPSILIDFNLETKKEIFNANYCYIAKFHRYYYITDVISLYLNLFQVSMKVDVLNSYKTNIYALSGMIRRNEFTFNEELVDEKLTQQIDYEIDIEEYTNSLFTYEEGVTTYNYIIVLSGRG